jgi:predicted RNase H-like HicB family nuclease
MTKYLVIIEQSATGYSAYVPDLPGCIATGDTKETTERNIYEAIQFHLEGMEAEGLDLPQPNSEAEAMVFS